MMFNKVITARFMKLGLGLAALGLAVAPAGLAAAQTDPAAAPAKPTLDPERVALARQIYDEVGVANLQAMSKALIASLQTVMNKSVSGPDGQRRQAMSDAISDSITLIIPKAVDATVDAMAEDFDTGQLRDLLAFYQSPTGRVMMRKMPLVLQQTSATLAAEMPEMVRQMQLRYCARVTCSTPEQQAFAALAAQVKAHAPS